MKTIDCIEQLTEQVKICNEVYACSSSIADILEKNRPTDYDDNKKYINAIKQMLYRLYYLHNIRSASVYKEYVECFDIKELKDFLSQRKIDLSNIPDSIKSILDKSSIQKSYDKIDKILSKDNIDQVFDFLYADIVNDINNDNIEIFDIIFERCIKAKNLLIDYCNSLELPDKPDWEFYK